MIKPHRFVLSRASANVIAIIVQYNAPRTFVFITYYVYVASEYWLTFNIHHSVFINKSIKVRN